MDLTFSGTVNTAAQLSGTLNTSLFIDDVFDAGSTGTFSGSFKGKCITLAAHRQAIREICTFGASLSGTRKRTRGSPRWAHRAKCSVEVTPQLTRSNPLDLCGKRKLLGRLVRPTGLEPATQGLGNPCSIHLSYGRLDACPEQSR